MKYVWLTTFQIGDYVKHLTTIQKPNKTDIIELTKLVIKDLDIKQEVVYFKKIEIEKDNTEHILYTKNTESEICVNVIKMEVVDMNKE